MAATAPKIRVGPNEAVHAGEHGVEIASSHRAINGAEAKILPMKRARILTCND